VATFRKDIGYVNGRSPSEIELTTAEEDASRRDFTINGMFYDPIEHVIHDFVQGAEDLKKGVIRTIGDPDERFVEDRLRMVRAVRFAARFGFVIDPDTQEAIAANADTLFPAVALERIWQELTKMSNYPGFDQALVEMHRLNLLPVIFSSLKDVHLQEIKKRIAGFKHLSPKLDTILYVMELFPHATREEAKELCQYLRTSNADTLLAEFLVLMRRAVADEHSLEIIDYCVWTHLYAHPAAQKCLEVIAAKMPSDQREAFLDKHWERWSMLKKHVDRIIEKKPLVNSAILKEEGIQPGKLMGTLLKEAERLAIIHNINDSSEVLTILKSAHVWPKGREI
jgi:poly(A) polymerase